MNAVVPNWKAAFLLPFAVCVMVSTNVYATPQQAVENPFEATTFDDTEEVPSDVAFSEWRLDTPDGEEEALTIYEPLYFIVGKNSDGSGDLKARFQISFKYSMFAEEGFVAELLPVMKSFRLGYTQTSLWNLSADSKPFEDTSYKPSFFFEFNTPQYGWEPDYWRVGYEHESNGQAGPDSRSIDIAFIQPAWGFRWGDEEVVLAPRLFGYLTKGEENKDIADYRGYGDLTIRYGSEDSFMASVTSRYGFAENGSLQLDLSYPIRQKIFSRAGGYVYMQLFHGYGESLLTYNQKEDLRIRIGFAIVR